MCLKILRGVLGCWVDSSAFVFVAVTLLLEGAVVLCGGMFVRSWTVFDVKTQIPSWPQYWLSGQSKEDKHLPMQYN